MYLIPKMIDHLQINLKGVILFDMEDDLIRLIFQLGIILIVAKLGGEVFERFLKQPGVLGELIGGILIGPYALGGMISIPYLGPLFTQAEIGPVSILYALSQIGAIVLLFTIGLGTDLRGFIKYGGPSSLIALGGVILPFALGDIIANAFGLASGFFDPVALFVGAIMTATSVGITTRVLEDIGSLRTPEGVTILGSAVIDDVLGVLILAIIMNLSQASALKGLLIVVKAVLFWLGLTGFSVLFSPFLSRLFGSFRSRGATVALGLALVFIASALAEMFGLAAIIGAFSMGLGLSASGMARTMRERLQPIYDTFVPVFFVVMGMMLDVRAMRGSLLFGLAVVILATVGKVLGCGLPALGVKFNWLGALRIGFGMVPRGEVGLVIAGAGIASGVIGSTIFGAAVMMTFATTVFMPPLLSFIFQRGGRGWKGSD
jgi:Kef-type K+ transport system membrane component KefB